MLGGRDYKPVSHAPIVSGCDWLLRKYELEGRILRMLHDKEFTGYDIAKQLSEEGAKMQLNYVYMILTEMADRGILKGRWEGNEEGLRKHFYTRGENGEQEFRGMQRGSLDFLMGAYVQTNFSRPDLPNLIQTYSQFLIQLYKALGVPIPNAQGTKLILAVPYCDPLTYHPMEYYALSEAFPNASINLVKPPEMRLYNERSNLVLLDGWRHDMPLKDNYADYLYLRGFPKCVSEEDAISESLRVLKEDGHFVVQVSNVMIEEKAPVCPSFSEFLSKLFYDIYDQDKVINLKQVKAMLSKQFKTLRDIESCGNMYLYASKRKA